MRAIWVDGAGGPEQMRLSGDSAEPQPAGDEVLVRVALAGVNFGDIHQREGQYVAERTPPFVLGGEVAGTVERAGAGFTAGERVVALLDTGGYAELAAAPAARSFRVPEGLDFASALALLIQGLTAWHLFRTAARIGPGESVVVHSAAGGVGGLATQLAKPMGAGRVIATASSPERRERALELGADAALDATVDDLAGALTAANERRGVDVVLETAGGRLFEESFAALAPLGRLVVYGNSTREKVRVSNAALLKTSRAVVGFWLYHVLGRRDMTEEPLRDLFARAAAGDLVPQVGATYPMSEARRAHEDLAARRTTGKLLLDPTA